MWVTGGPLLATGLCSRGSLGRNPQPVRSALSPGRGCYNRTGLWRPAGALRAQEDWLDRSIWCQKSPGGGNSALLPPGSRQAPLKTRGRRPYWVMGPALPRSPWRDFKALQTNWKLPDSSQSSWSARGTSAALPAQLAPLPAPPGPVHSSHPKHSTSRKLWNLTGFGHTYCHSGTQEPCCPVGRALPAACVCEGREGACLAL